MQLTDGLGPPVSCQLQQMYDWAGAHQKMLLHPDRGRTSQCKGSLCGMLPLALPPTDILRALTKVPKGAQVTAAKHKGTWAGLQGQAAPPRPLQVPQVRL